MADGKVKIDIEADDSKFQKTVDGLDDEARTAAEGMNELGDSGEKVKDSLGAADVAAGSLVANGLSALVSGAMDAVGALIELADSTREYREDMAKLQTAFTTQGHSTDTAKAAYQDFYAILGESDRAVEAVNHLAELTSNEQELAQWSTIAAGVTAKFGDSLPIEGLTEAANETAKVGEVTGPLADALNWAGISEDEFNEKLAACNSEQERAALITETLNSEYAAAAEEYNNLTGSAQDARRATSEMEEAQANLGAAIEPVTTAWTNLKTNALEAILPVVESVAGKLTDLSNWMDENPEKAEIVKGALVAVAAAVGVLVIAFGGMMIINTLKTAFASFGVAMSGAFLPVTLIVAGVAALAAGFIYLWNNCDGFREFFINMWDKIKSAASAVAEWFNATWPIVVDFLKSIWGSVSGFFVNLWDGIKSTASSSMSAVRGFFSSAWEAIKGILNEWAGFFSGIWDSVKEVFTDAVDIGSQIVEDIKEGISSAWEGLTSWFNGIWDSLFNRSASVSVNKSGSVKATPHKTGLDYVPYDGYFAMLHKGERVLTAEENAAYSGLARASVGVSSAAVSRSMGQSDVGFTDLARAVGIQTAGINSLSAAYKRGSGNTRPIYLMLDRRELGRAFMDAGGEETGRVGVKLSLGGA